MRPIAVFYHCLFYKGEDFLPGAVRIAHEQMMQLNYSGLLDACQFMLCGINGGKESEGWANHLLPQKAKKVFHGIESHTENYTLYEIEKWAVNHPGWLVLYFHCKGATRPIGDGLRKNWRICMMRNLVWNWRRCVKDMEEYHFEAVGCHWMTGDKTPANQSIFAGNFWWADSDYLTTLPSMLSRDRIKLSGMGSVESRYESEVWIGNGQRLPRVKDYHPEWIDQCKP